MADNHQEKNTHVLTIRPGSEHMLMVAQDITDSDSLMYPAYSSALDALDGIIANSDRWNKQQSDSTEKESLGLYGYDNNILAFCAPRGQGKTSAMLSFSRALARFPYYKRLGYMKAIKNPYADKEKKLANLIADRRFYVLPPIDPTMLNDGDSIVQLVVGKLFEEISDRWSNPLARDKNLDAYGEDKKINIMDEFKKCYQGLPQAKKKRQENSDGNDFDRMLQSNDTFKVKRALHKIINYFFQLRGGTWKVGESFLVVQLDDTDMQFENAYSILEEVRKYLSIPNTLLLMATDLDQLRKLIAQHYANQFGISGNRDTSVERVIPNTRDTWRMAAKYLDKLIPVTQTIYLPTIKLEWEHDSELKLKIETEDTNDPDKTPEAKRLEKVMFDLIYEKTGLVFILHSTYLHNILPSTLRGLQHLYRMLDRMVTPEPINDLFLKTEAIRKDNDENEGNYKRIRNHLEQKQLNLELFENYFINDWCSSKLKEKTWNILSEINDVAAVRRIKYALKIVGKHDGILDSSEDDIKYATVFHAHKLGCWASKATATTTKVKPKNVQNGVPEENPEDFSYLALLKRLKVLEDACITEYDFRYVFALRTYFTIQFNKAAIVDEITSLDDWAKKEPKDEDIFNFDYRRLRSYVYGSQYKGKPISLEGVGSCFQSEPTSSNDTGNKNLVNEVLYQHLQLLNINFENYNDRAQGSILQLQKYATYACCNWDVQDQLTQIANNEGSKPWNILDRVINVIERKNAVWPLKEKEAKYSNPITVIDAIKGS